jgi:Ni2+-binding GTPase involved in maturation of urease and hydrogenase
MDVHLVGGFLGSGKTTAIISAAKQVMRTGKRVGVVTNDQGKYLVDTAFVRWQDVPTVEVTGGCFCCNYDDLEQRLDALHALAQPDIIFAESVGSCADVVATVLKPLRQLRAVDVARTSLSVFVDSRLLGRYLRGEDLLFSEHVVYIFEQQLRETGLIVLNKIDLLPDVEVQELERLVRQRFPQTRLHRQNSLSPTSVQAWTELLMSGQITFPESEVTIDYARYGAGEAQLAWFDAELQLTVPAGQGRKICQAMLGNLNAAIRGRNWPIGHVKFLLRGATLEHKVSFVTLPEADWQAELPNLSDTHLTLVINARVETDAAQLRAMVLETIATTAQQYASACVETTVAAFHPSMPQPRHRFA